MIPNVVYRLLFICVHVIYVLTTFNKDDDDDDDDDNDDDSECTWLVHQANVVDKNKQYTNQIKLKQ